MLRLKIRSAAFVAVAFAFVLLAASVAGPVVAEGPVPEFSIGSVALNVEDLARSEKYYAEVLGFVRTGTYPPDGKNPIEIFLSRPGGKGGAGLILARVNNDPLPDGRGRYGRIIVNTAEAKAVEALANAAGSESREIKLPGDNPPVIIFFNDPDGYEIELYQAPK